MLISLVNVVILTSCPEDPSQLTRSQIQSPFCGLYAVFPPWHTHLGLFSYHLAHSSQAHWALVLPWTPPGTACHSFCSHMASLTSFEFLLRCLLIEEPFPYHPDNCQCPPHCKPRFPPLFASRHCWTFALCSSLTCVLVVSLPGDPFLKRGTLWCSQLYPHYPHPCQELNQYLLSKWWLGEWILRAAPDSCDSSPLPTADGASDHQSPGEPAPRQVRRKTLSPLASWGFVGQVLIGLHLPLSQYKEISQEIVRKRSYLPRVPSCKDYGSPQIHGWGPGLSQPSGSRCHQKPQAWAKNVPSTHITSCHWSGLGAGSGRVTVWKC